jgi:uncharacterized OB-fold protein
MSQYIPNLADQGLEMIVCSNCGAIYYDLKRAKRTGLHCIYCGVRPTSDR